MEHLKTYEGFLDIFKKSEDDKIALVFINRLKKVKRESPYDIEKKVEPWRSQDDTVEVGEIISYTIHFDDASVKAKTGRYYDSGMKDIYKIRVECTGDWEIVKCSEKYERQLFDIIEKVYKQNIEWVRINKIRGEINPEADLIDEDYGSNRTER